MEIWFYIGTFVFVIGLTHVVYRFMNPKEDDNIYPNLPLILPPAPPPIPRAYGTVNILSAGGGGKNPQELKSATGTNGRDHTTYTISTDELIKVQEDLGNTINPLFLNLAGVNSHHKIPILESSKRKEEKHEPKEKPTRKITY